MPAWHLFLMLVFTPVGWVVRLMDLLAVLVRIRLKIRHRRNQTDRQLRCTR
jgi:hypothetical protein